MQQGERELAASALANFPQEIEGNLATLERVNPKHAALAERMEAAVSTGALQLLPYGTAALLAETYQIQRITVVPTVQRLADRIMEGPQPARIFL